MIFIYFSSNLFSSLNTLKNSLLDCVDVAYFRESFNTVNILKMYL